MVIEPRAERRNGQPEMLAGHVSCIVLPAWGALQAHSQGTFPGLQLGSSGLARFSAQDGSVSLQPAKVRLMHGGQCGSSANLWECHKQGLSSSG